ncbi:MAG: DJ-1/PfpI family protein [Phycisphaerae bacterium]|nr:DJ-1/PfpI family protein [Phycisphaerae bacterium]
MVFFGLLAVAGTGTGRQSQPGPTRRAAASRLQVIQLPEPSTSSAVGVEQALLALHNLAVPGSQRLDLPKISQLAWALQKVIVAPSTNPVGPVAAPTEITAMKVYFVLPNGVHLYNPLDHTLQQIDDQDVREAMAAALMNQTGAPTGGCQVVLAASAPDYNRRYNTRGRTVMLLQAGQMSRSMQLEAVAQGLTFVSIDAVDAAAVRRVMRGLRTQEPLYVAFVGYPAGQAPSTPGGQARASQATVLLVVPPQGFQDEELLATKRGLEQAGAQVLLASTRMGLLTGMMGGTARADLLLNQANLDNFSAIVFIGGVGTIDYLNSPVVAGVVRQAAAKRKVLAAIGTAPSILAGAGALKGARATAYLSEQARLVQGGALYTGNAVEKDGLTVTATGVLAVTAFVRTIGEALAEMGPSATH